MDTRREWIIVGGRQVDRDIQLAMTKGISSMMSGTS
jgi:hypothetical protein